jgi:hypothetical protein
VLETESIRGFFHRCSFFDILEVSLLIESRLSKGTEPETETNETTEEEGKDKMESKNSSGRGRPVEPEVQARRLEEEALKVREIEGRLAEVNLKFASGIDTALRLVRRLEKHLTAALKARVLLTENRG